MALGAAKADILRLVVRHGLTLVAIGVGIGLMLALVLSVVMASRLSGILYKISPHDLATFVAAPVVFLMIALLASYLPARRATQVDPNEALRGS